MSKETAREYWNTPCASKPWISYRYAGNYGWIMIGARDHVDALNEANRSLERPNATIDRLQVWNGNRYIPCEVAE